MRPIIVTKLILLVVAAVSGGLTGTRSIADVLKNTAIEDNFLQVKNLRDFQDCALYPKGRYGCYFIFGQEQFPEIQWEKPYLVEKIMGRFSLKVRWFDAELNKVNVPRKPGRYAAVIEGTNSYGIHVRRAITVYHRPKDWRPWKNNPKVYVEYLLGGPIDKNAWDERKDLIASYAGKLFFELMTNEPQGAVLMSYLTEMKVLERQPTKMENPDIQNDDYHLALKRKLLGKESNYTTLKMPCKVQGKSTPVLHTGTLKEARVKQDTVRKLRTVCQQWYAQSKGPFVILVARHGVIIIHEAFGESPKGLITIDKPIGIFSITKLITGVMFAQFIDQGLISPDDPVGKFLPDFPIQGDKTVTMRHCFTHTSGLEGHLKWGGMHNPWLDNVIANGLFYLKPGKTFKYNGMGYDLVGKVMEMVSGKSVFRLMYENLFQPLCLMNTTMDDMATASTSTAEDIAKIGQLLLNKGTYGNLKYFSPKTFEKLLPQPLNRFYPTVSKDWGIGLKWMHQQNPYASKSSAPANKTILNRNVIGHSGGWRSEMRVDLDNDLVIVQIHSQNKDGGEAFEKFKTRFLSTIENSLIK